MLELLTIVVAIAFVGAALVPVVVLSLARLGHFEPVEFYLFGREWKFAPQKPIATTYSNAVSSIIGQTAGAMPVVLTVIAQLHTPVVAHARMSISISESITLSDAIARSKDIQCDWV